MLEVNRMNVQTLEHKLLELTLQEKPLELILNELVLALQSFVGNDFPCSILLAEKEDRHLHHGAAVGLPTEYTDAVDGLAIGPKAGSCGTAAYRKEPVYVADIAQDPLWEDFQDLVSLIGLKACWSQPVIGAKGDIHGTFAIYSPHTGHPSTQIAEFLTLVARTTALILERYAAQEELNDQQRLLETLNRVGAGIAAELDLEKIVQMVTEAGVELTGAQFGAFFYTNVETNGESYMLYALAGAERSAFEHFPQPRSTEVFKPTFEGTGILRSDDITKDPRYGKNTPYRGMPKGHLPVRSYLSVPVILRSGEVIGGLFFGHGDAARFSQHHENLMEGIAGQAAISIDNARLYQAAQREIEVRRKAETALIDTQEELQAAQERIELALAAGAIIGTWIWDILEDKVTADERFARAFGLDTSRCSTGFSFAEVTEAIHPDDMERVAGMIEQAMAKGGEYRAEYRVRHCDDRYRWVEANGYCYHDENGNPVRFPGILIDIEHSRQIESDLRRREADLALLLDATADGFYAVDTDGRTTRCNASFLRMLGFENEEDVVGKKLHDVIHHSHADGTHYPHDDCPIYRVARSGEMAHVDDEVFFRTDGTSFHVEYWVRPVIWQGELQGAVCNIVDISERKRAEDARQLLLRELNHRIKNLFAVTTGMIQMTARNVGDVDAMAKALTGRLMSLARAHELITVSITAREDSVVPTHLEQLITAVMEPHVGHRDTALELDGPTVDIGPTATTSLALVLHELATNTAKYGALSDPEGRVAVSWDVTDQGLTLLWRESGGPAVTEPTSRVGFGTQLARLSVKGQLGGTIEYNWKPEGVEISLTASADRLEH